MSSRDPSRALPPTIVARVDEPEHVDAHGRRWILGFDDSTSPPGVIWAAVTTWSYMEGLFATWDIVAALTTSWQEAEAF